MPAASLKQLQKSLKIFRDLQNTLLTEHKNELNDLDIENYTYNRDTFLSSQENLDQLKENHLKFYLKRINRANEYLESKLLHLKLKTNLTTTISLLEQALQYKLDPEDRKTYNLELKETRSFKSQLETSEFMNVKEHIEDYDDFIRQLKAHIKAIKADETLEADEAYETSEADEADETSEDSEADETDEVSEADKVKKALESTTHVLATFRDLPDSKKAESDLSGDDVAVYHYRTPIPPSDNDARSAKKKEATVKVSQPGKKAH